MPGRAGPAARGPWVKPEQSSSTWWLSTMQAVGRRSSTSGPAAAGARDPHFCTRPIPASSRKPARVSIAMSRSSRSLRRLRRPRRRQRREGAVLPQPVFVTPRGEGLLPTPRSTGRPCRQRYRPRQVVDLPEKLGPYGRLTEGARRQLDDHAFRPHEHRCEYPPAPAPALVRSDKFDPAALEAHWTSS